MDIDDILVEAHRLLEGLEDESGVADHLRSIDRLMDDTLAEVEQRMEHGCNGITGIPTGFDALDHVTAGWQRGDLNILAARPSVGKTAFALHLARAAAMAGRHVVVFSLEMQGERLGDAGCLQPIAMDIAGKVIEREINEKDHEKLIDEFISNEVKHHDRNCQSIRWEPV